jgi:hypothetical protein
VEWDRVRPEGDALERLTWVPGVVGDVVDWIVWGALFPNRPMALAVALGVVGTVLSKKVEGPTGNGTHLFISLIAETASGKDHPMKCGPALLRGMGLGELVGPTKLGSMVGFEEEMARRPTMACFVDEFGDLLALINGQGQNVNMSSLIGTLKLAWNSHEVIRTAPRRDNEGVEIREPAVTIVGATTKMKFFGSVPAGDLESGFANRLLIPPFEGRPEPELQDRPAQALVAPKGLVTRLRGLVRHRGKEMSDKELLASMDVERVGWTEGANAVWKGMHAKVKALKRSDPWRHEVSARAPEQALRMATIVAAGRGGKFGERVVEREDMAWAAELAWMCVDAACEGYAKYMEKSLSFPALYQVVLERIGAEADGWCSTFELKRFFRAYQRKGWELDKALGQLKAERRIEGEVERPGKHKTRGKPSPGYAVLQDDPAETQ